MRKVEAKSSKRTADEMFKEEEISETALKRIKKEDISIDTHLGFSPSYFPSFASLLTA